MSELSHAGPPKTAAKVTALLLFLVLMLAPTPEGLSPAAQRVAAVTGLMAVLWFTQAIPIAATSLVPLALFPLLGIQSAARVSNSYVDENVLLFLGGILIALGIEKWGLHRRMALHIVRVVGSSPRRIVLGFMLATGFLSMWVSNTASTLLMLPIGLAMLDTLADLRPSAKQGGPQADSASSPTLAASATSQAAARRFAAVLMLGIAYAASIGGMTTLVGTATNVAFQKIWKNQFPAAPELSAGHWITAFFPLGVVLLAGAWLVLTFRLPTPDGMHNLGRGYFTGLLRGLGRATSAERRMLAIFGTTAALWIFRTPLQLGSEPLLPGWGATFERFLVWIGTDPQLAATAIHDSTIGLAMALLLFFIPGRRDASGRVEYLMDWQTAERLPWGILLLIGGGFALADAFAQTGLSLWLGDALAAQVANWPVWLLIAAVCLLMTFLTEFTTNVATVNAILPVLAGTAVAIGIDPRLVMIPAALSTSCAFMLPIATPPNAIVFGSGRIDMGQMARYGILINLLGVVLITLAAFFILVPQLGITPGDLPEWATESQR